MSRPHAILPPSGASRWLACTPSARLEQQFPDRKSVSADEGTLAHSLAELLIGYKLGRVSELQYIKALEVIQENELYEQAMYDHCDEYATFVIERYAEALAHTKDAQIYTEQRIDLTAFIPEGFGTGDVFIIADSWLDFIDLKYGKGVPVSAENNSQMKVYATGAVRDFECLYDLQNVRMTIYQPRLDNISTWEMSVADLKAWAENELKPRARMAFNGEGEFKPGDHCRFCKAKAMCKALASHNLELAKHDFKEPVLLTDDEVSDILGKIDQLKTWASAVSDHALEEAVKNGKKWPGWKVVEGRSNRTYTSEQDVATSLMDNAGYAEEVIYKKKILGITDMEKLLGKKAFNTYLGDYVTKPAGKPALAPVTDKRPEYSPAASAVDDFANIEIED